MSYTNSPYAPGGYIDPFEEGYFIRKPDSLTDEMIRDLKRRNAKLICQNLRLASKRDGLRISVNVLKQKTTELREKLDQAETDKSDYVHPLEHNMVKSMKNTHRNISAGLKAKNDELYQENRGLKRRLDQLEGRTETATPARTIPNKEDVKQGEAWRVKTSFGIHNAIRAGVTPSFRAGDGDDMYIWAFERNGTVDWFSDDNVELIEPLTPDTRRVITETAELEKLAVGSAVINDTNDIWTRIHDGNYVCVDRADGRVLTRTPSELFNWGAPNVTLIYDNHGRNVDENVWKE